MTRLTRFVRRLRFGHPIIVVSGLPRSGTSMMMQMLAAGGMPIVTDGVRQPDESNPNGYFELEAVKELERGVDVAWLEGARGRAVKVLSPLLSHLPERYNYRVILMQRDLAEVIASQNTMLTQAGEPADVIPVSQLAATYQAHLRTVEALLARRACFERLVVNYRDVITDPLGQATRVSRFVGGALAVDRMAAATDERLHRNRPNVTVASRSRR